MKSNSLLANILTKMGFIRSEDFEGEIWTLNKVFANKNFIKISFTPTDFNDGNSVIDISWKLIESEGNEILINTNPITVFSELFEHFEDRADTYDISLIAEEIMNRVSQAMC